MMHFDNIDTPGHFDNIDYTPGSPSAFFRGPRKACWCVYSPAWLHERSESFRNQAAARPTPTPAAGADLRARARAHAARRLPRLREVARPHLQAGLGKTRSQISNIPEDSLQNSKSSGVFELSIG